jgi:hypothetical protein
MAAQNLQPQTVASSPKNPSNSPNNGDGPSAPPADAHPDPARLFAWAQTTAAQNASRRSSSVSPLIAAPEPIQDRFMRLANMDDATAAKRSAEAKAADERRYQAHVANLIAYNGVPPRYESLH